MPLQATPADGLLRQPRLPPASRSTGGQANLAGPKGPGWIVKLEGCHYHNDMQNAGSNFGAQYVRNTLIENLLNAKVKLPSEKAQ